MITVYTLSSSTSSRAAIAYLKSCGQSFLVQNMSTHPLSFEELKHILTFTENGVSDLLSRSKVVKELEEAGVNFEELTLSEFHSYVEAYPKLLRAPITLKENSLMIGYEINDFGMFVPREARRQSYEVILKTVRKEENEQLFNREKISGGHWG